MDVPNPPTYNTLVVRPHIAVTAEDRDAVLKSVEYNLFAFPAALVTSDFLSDSGTSAMTDIQWAAMLRGDESYGRNWGYYCLLDAFRDIFERGNARENIYRDVLAGIADSRFFLNELLKEHTGGFVNGGPAQLMRPNFFLVPQGRCAEALLFSTLGASMDRKREPRQQIQHVIISNGFFDTTSANISIAGFETKAFPQLGLIDPYPINLVGIENPFKGNLDSASTAEYLENNSHRITMILLTITNNWAAGQPVSMANIKATYDLARKHEIPLFFDACRFAENAKFIQDFEPGCKDKNIPQVVREMFSYADGFTISLKKDGLANMGGALCFRDGGLFAKKFPDIGIELEERQIVCYGNDSYGGMSGRDIMAACVGLYEVTKESYLSSRIGQVRSFAEKLVAQGIPVLLPPGGHAIFLDMDRFFDGCGRSYGEFAGLGFVIELLMHYGIRAMKAGPWGWQWDRKSEQDRHHIPNLVRFAVPRHVMNNEHIEYTVAAVTQLYKRRHNIPGVKIVREKDLRIRHFSCSMEPLPVQNSSSNSDEPGTFLAAAKSDLSNLCSSLGLNGSWQQLDEALELAMHPWGTNKISSQKNG
ncbi:hypothetical protein HYALB_00008002 [Hymenoscyphus albidus]|uniref:Aromatic amino acid beta-eliminating lyase/threonine aldolase domain-containing protein n=1 Tax=Hymenoscyphus albidus TaxID=595503 RepID=A0A9N9Q1E7_9HELO|nr:hypothetical protein HYALB_00008002 [Hymenoscyphus albidus]